jgi:hypothetical protein
MTPEMIRQLPARRALVVRGGHSPVIARLPMCWKNPAYRAACRNRQAIARVAPVTGQTTAPWPRTMPDPESDSDPGDVFTPARRGNGGLYPWHEDHS